MSFEVLHLLALQKQNRNNRTRMSYKKKRRHVGSSAHIHHPLLIPTSVDLTCMSAQRLENTHTQTTTMPMRTMYKNANETTDIQRENFLSLYPVL